MQDSYSKEFTEFKFPSPIGELHFSIQDGGSSEIRDRVSVPYRGATFLNFFRVLPPIIYVLNCFRPLSGSYISQFYFQRCGSVWGFWFPSPIGELHFSIGFPGRCIRLVRSVSVPYRGATFLNRVTFSNDPAYFWLDQFPSPIGELHFSMMLQAHTCISSIVSVPYRGATFLNELD